MRIGDRAGMCPALARDGTMAQRKAITVQAKVAGRVVLDETAPGTMRRDRAARVRAAVAVVDGAGLVGEALIRLRETGANAWAVYAYAAGSGEARLVPGACWE